MPNSGHVACAREPKDGGRQWLVYCASGVSGRLLCEDGALPLPGRGLTGGAGAIAGRQQPCLPWEGAATGALGRGGGPRPPREAAGILWSPSPPRPGARERDAAPRLTPGGHRQSCRCGSQPRRSGDAGGAPTSGEAAPRHWGVLCCPRAGLPCPGWILLPFSRCHEVEYHLRL